MTLKPFHVLAAGQHTTALRHDKKEPRAIRARRARRNKVNDL